MNTSERIKEKLTEAYSYLNGIQEQLKSNPDDSTLQLILKAIEDYIYDLEHQLMLTGGD